MQKANDCSFTCCRYICLDFFSIAYAICTPSFYTILSKLKIIEFTDTRNLCCFTDWWCFHDCIQTRYTNTFNSSMRDKSVSQLVAFVTSWPSFIKLCTWALHVAARRSAAPLPPCGSLKSMRMIWLRVKLKWRGMLGMSQRNDSTRRGLAESKPS